MINYCKILTRSTLVLTEGEVLQMLLTLKIWRNLTIQYRMIHLIKKMIRWKCTVHSKNKVKEVPCSPLVGVNRIWWLQRKSINLLSLIQKFQKCHFLLTKGTELKKASISLINLMVMELLQTNRHSRGRCQHMIWILEFS